jgi:hypothetical protein
MRSSGEELINKRRTNIQSPIKNYFLGWVNCDPPGPPITPPLSMQDQH